MKHMSSCGNIDIAEMLGQKYRYRIGIGHGDIDPPIVNILQK